jgi:hypothetical protein
MKDLIVSIDALDSIQVDVDGMCAWTDVANALADIRRHASDHAPTAKQLVLPDGMVIGDFKPCFMVNEVMNMVEVLFEDVSSTSKPLIDGVYHWIDQLVAHDDGRVVGLNFWIYKPPGKAPHSAATTVEPEACGPLVCKAAKDDGVICADDECDRVNGVRPAPSTATSECPTPLHYIAGQIKRWLEWDREHRREADLVTTGDTHIMSLPVPFWPSHGQFERWIAALESADLALRAAPTTSPEPTKCSECNGWKVTFNGAVCLECSGEGRATSPEPDAVREALEAARGEIVCAIAFLGRDSGTDRLQGTVDGLIKRLVEADKAAIATLSRPAHGAKS